MGAEFNVLDWLFAAGQGLFGASLLYFFYLVMGQSGISPTILNELLRRSGRLTYRPNAPIDRYLLME